MLPPTPHIFILFELDFDVKFPLLRLLIFLSDLKSTILYNIISTHIESKAKLLICIQEFMNLHLRKTFIFYLDWFQGRTQGG